MQSWQERTDTVSRAHDMSEDARHFLILATCCLPSANCKTAPSCRVRLVLPNLTITSQALTSYSQSSDVYHVTKCAM